MVLSANQKKALSYIGFLESAKIKLHGRAINVYTKIKGVETLISLGATSGVTVQFGQGESKRIPYTDPTLLSSLQNLTGGHVGEFGDYIVHVIYKMLSKKDHYVVLQPENSGKAFFLFAEKNENKVVDMCTFYQHAEMRATFRRTELAILYFSNEQGGAEEEVYISYNDVNRFKRYVTEVLDDMYVEV